MSGGRSLSVLRSKRDASAYQILVAIADRQPAVSQREIAEEIGLTAQAVSDYIRDLVEKGYVEKRGRGRYAVTKEGVDWLISRTDDLQSFAEYVEREVIGQVDTETAIATALVEAGDRVTLTMHRGILQATPGEGSATAVALNAADEGEDVGVTDFEGMLEYELGAVTVVSVPDVADGGSRAVDGEDIAELGAEHALVAVAGVEALAAARASSVEPDIRFGTAEAVAEAATKGVAVLLLAVDTVVSTHTDRLRASGISYEVVDAGAE